MFLTTFLHMNWLIIKRNRPDIPTFGMETLRYAAEDGVPHLIVIFRSLPPVIPPAFAHSRRWKLRLGPDYTFSHWDFSGRVLCGYTGARPCPAEMGWMVVSTVLSVHGLVHRPNHYSRHQAWMGCTKGGHWADDGGSRTVRRVIALARLIFAIRERSTHSRHSQTQAHPPYLCRKWFPTKFPKTSRLKNVKLLEPPKLRDFCNIFLLGC